MKLKVLKPFINNLNCRLVDKGEILEIDNLSPYYEALIDNDFVAIIISSNAWLKAFYILLNSCNNCYKFDNNTIKYFVKYNFDIHKLTIVEKVDEKYNYLYFNSEQEARDSIEKYDKYWLIYLGVED